MAFEDYQTKDSVVIIYTGEGKGKTSAAIGLLARALGSGWRCAFIQFIKSWEVGEHRFIKQIEQIYKSELTFYRGGKGFYDLGEISARGVTKAQHKAAAQVTLAYASKLAANGKFDLVICDEINVALQQKLVTENQLKRLIKNKHPKTSLCLTGRGFPNQLLDLADIATNMTKLKHHFDNKYLANKGIDY